MRRLRKWIEVVSKEIKKSAQELGKGGSKSYDIKGLWQRGRDLSVLSAANSQGELGQPPELRPNDHISRICPLSEVPRGGAPSLSKQEMFKDQPVEALRDLSKPLESVKAQEKKYGDRLSPHSNFYHRHIMVLQIQLTTRPSQTRRSFSCNVARSFGRGTFTARNIV